MWAYRESFDDITGAWVEQGGSVRGFLIPAVVQVNTQQSVICRKCSKSHCWVTDLSTSLTSGTDALKGPSGFGM